MTLRLPTPRKVGLLNRAWLWPTNLVGHAIARLSGAKGPYPVGSDRAPAQYYLLSDRFKWWFGAVTLGHVIVAQPGCLRGAGGKWTMAHELAHTRQHDVLGPFYLPLHALCQLVSTLISMVRPLPGFSNVHAYNPLERGFLCVPFDYLVAFEHHQQVPTDPFAQDVLRAFGVGDFECRPLEVS